MATENILSCVLFVYASSTCLQACSQPVFSGRPEGPFCLYCTFIFRNEGNWIKKCKDFRKTGKSGLTRLTDSYAPGLIHCNLIAIKIANGTNCSPATVNKQN